MAGELKVGRVSLGHPTEMTENRGVDSREFAIRGFIRETTQAATEAIRDQLLEQQGQLVAISYTGDSAWAGFYILADVSITSMEASYLNQGLWLFEINAYRIGGTSRVDFQSNITGTVLENGFSITELNTMPFLGLPVGAELFLWPTSVSTYSHTRDSEDGTVPVFINEGEFTTDATWASTPATYYGGACKLTVDGVLQTGLDIPNTPGDWVLDNGIVRIQPEISGTPTGRLLIDVWDGVSAYESQKDWTFSDTADAGAVDNLSFISCVQNDPESIIIRLSAEWVTSSVARHTIDLNLRRGAPFVMVNWFHGAAVNSTMKAVRDTTEAGSTFNAWSSGSTVGVVATADDGDGNKYMICTPSAHTADTTNGGLQVASTERLKCAIGFQIAGASAVTHDDAPRVADQYLGNVGERVRAVWR